MRPWESILLVLVTLGVVCLSVLLPSQLGPLANPQERISEPSPVWFLYPLFLVNPMLPWWASPLIVIFGLAATGSVAWVLGGRGRAVVEPAQPAPLPADEPSQSP